MVGARFTNASRASETKGPELITRVPYNNAALSGQTIVRGSCNVSDCGARN